MAHIDVLIVGGGPAGAACAWVLRRAGMDVAVLDQARFPRDKVCAGWITPAVLESLAIDPAEYGRDHVIQPIRAFRLGLMSGMARSHAATAVRYGATVSYGIRRCEFDDYLLRRSGARLLTGEPVRALRRDDGEWLVDDAIRTPMLVGAGGHACPVARFLRARPDGEPVVRAREIEFPLTEAGAARCKVKGEEPELYFCADLAGYGWCFRKGNHLNIGLGRDDRQDLAAHVDGFVAFLKRERGVPEPPGPLRGHAYLLHGQSKRDLVADGALLIGDAAGLAYPRSGEGIRPAVESGLLAAQTILDAVGDYRRQRLAPYLERLRLRFGAESALDAMVPDWIGAALARGLFGYPSLARRLVLDPGFLHPNLRPLPPEPVAWL